MIRTLGIALGVGFAVTLLLRKQWREFAFAMVGIALFVVPWLLWTMHHGGEIPPVLYGDYGTYGSWVGAALHTGRRWLYQVRVAQAKPARLLDHHGPVRRARHYAGGPRRV